jgi:hypothetical protein
MVVTLREEMLKRVHQDSWELAENCPMISGGDE